MSRNSQRGSAMLVTLIIIASLLAGAAVIVGMQLSTNRSTDLTRSGMTALYCAEAGLEAAHPIVAANYPLWNTQMCPQGVGLESNCFPAGATPAAMLANQQLATPMFTIPLGNQDLDGDGVPDYILYLRDDDDEVAPTPQNYTLDADQKIFIVSTCVKFPDTPKQVKELVLFNGGGSCQNYHQQGVDCTGRGNAD